MIKKTEEDYIRAVFHITEEKEVKKGVSSTDICGYLDLSKSSVSEMLRKLAKERLIKHESYGKIVLTRKGLTKAMVVTKRHRIIEVFLSKILKIKSKAVHGEAHRLEHAFSKNSINSITKMIKNTKSCPHGKPIC